MRRRHLGDVSESIVAAVALDKTGPQKRIIGRAAGDRLRLDSLVSQKNSKNIFPVFSLVFRTICPNRVRNIESGLPIRSIQSILLSVEDTNAKTNEGEMKMNSIETRERMLRELMSDLMNLVESGDITDMEANEWYNMKADQWANGI